MINKKAKCSGIHKFANLVAIIFVGLNSILFSAADESLSTPLTSSELQTLTEQWVYNLMDSMWPSDVYLDEMVNDCTITADFKSAM